MRDFVLRWMWPYLIAGALVLALGVLTALTWRSKRGSPLYRARLAVLAALVAVMGSAVGCSSNQPTPESGTEAQPAGQGGGEVTPPPDQPPPPPIMPTCYAPMELPERDGGVAPGGGDGHQPPVGPPPSCYQPRVVPPPAADGGTVTPPPPRRMCYAPRRRDPDRDS